MLCVLAHAAKLCWILRPSTLGSVLLQLGAREARPTGARQALNDNTCHTCCKLILLGLWGLG